MQIDLTKFCHQEDGRFKISKPFDCGDGWRGATDGRMAVRIRTTNFGDIVEHSRTPDSPDLSKVFPSREVMESEHVPIDASLFVVMTKESLDKLKYGSRDCPICSGFAQETRECKVCKGNGDRPDLYECEHCGHVPECDSCGGKGVHPIEGGAKCLYCENGVRYNDLRLGVKLANGSLLKKLVASLPGLEVISRTIMALDRAPIAFVFDGGQALLTPMMEPN